MTAILDIIKNATNWNEIYDRLLSAQSSGKLFEAFCKYYYLCEPSVSPEYKNVWFFSEVPLAVKRKLGLGKVDHGIDLVLENQEGEFSVVQCKFRKHQGSKLSWSSDKIANLFADGDKADYFVVFTNVSGIDKHSLSKKERQLKLVTFGDLVNISKATIQAIESYVLGKTKPKTTKKEPRDYQIAAIKDVVNGFKKSARGQLILPCGAGKTMVSLWIKEAMLPNHTIILFPSLALLRQTKNEWAANQKEYTPYICICSEQDIDKHKDSVITHTYEINGRVLTDAEDIKLFLQKHPRTIVYSTYQSLKVVSEAVKSLGFRFDLAICDEAHKTSGSKLGSFGLIHSDEKIPVVKRLYMTATPRIISESLKSQNPEELQYIADMSNSQIYGSEFHRMSFKEAIDRGILVDYKIVAIGVGDKEIQEAILERRFASDNATLDEIANNYALDKFMNEHNSRHAITFHSSISKAEAFKNRHEALYPEVNSFHVNGRQTTNDRNQLMKAFEYSPKSIITNARCLTEGVDVPAIDTVYFCDPKNSKIDIVQAAGRALRRADHKSKTNGYIVVPIYHREANKLDQIIEDSPFKNLISIVMAMSDHDERLMDEIKSIKLGKGKRTAGTEHISIEIAGEIISFEGFEKQLADSLFSQVIDKVRMPWRSFEEAREFARSLKLSGGDDWREYSKSVQKPSDIPASPEGTYKNKGWTSWGDWLGTGNIASYNKQFLSYEEARKFVHTLNLRDNPDWIKYVKSGIKPDDIPAAPSHVYKSKGWTSWGDWLGTGSIASFNRQYLSYEAARKFVHALNLRGKADWAEYAKSNSKPDYIPASPSSVYENKGWISWGDWLGTGNIAPHNRQFLLYAEAREFVHRLGLKSSTEWREYSKSALKPYDIPATPEGTYKDKGWVSINDWLGTAKAPNKDIFLPYEEAKKFTHALNLKNIDEWREYCKSGMRPVELTAKPERVYRDKGWVSWGDWLGTGSIANRYKTYLPFSEARNFAHNLGLISLQEWSVYAKSSERPSNIPAWPAQIYKGKGWISTQDWLGYDSKIIPFNEAREFVHKLYLKSEKEWREYCKSGERPTGLPATPYKVYENKGWVSWGDWLGTGSIAVYNKLFLPYEEAKKFVHTLNLQNEKEWREYCKNGSRPPHIAANPRQTYENKGWISMSDWLGVDSKS